MYLKEQGIQFMYVWVFSSNATARRFYAALGGQKIAERTVIIAGEEIGETAYGWPAWSDFTGSRPVV